MAKMKSCLMSLMLGLPLALAAGCGDDGGGGNMGADAGDGDGDPDACVPDIHNDCDDEEPVERLEGGEFRFEYLETPMGTVARGTGFMLTNQETFPFPEIGSCVFLGRPEEYWWFGQSPDRQYIDLGDSVTFSGGAPMDVVQTPGTADFFARQHELSYTYQCGPGTPNECAWEDYLTMGAGYDVEVAGSEDFPATTFEGKLYMPAAWQPDTPAFDGTAVALTKGSDYTVKWEAVDDPGVPAEGVAVTLIGFVEPMVGPHTACLVENTGEFTVPSAIVDQLPAGGMMVVGVTAHVEENIEVDGEQRTVDFVGMNCRVTPFAVSDPQ